MGSHRRAHYDTRVDSHPFILHHGVSSLPDWTRARKAARLGCRSARVVHPFLDTPKQTPYGVA